MQPSHSKKTTAPSAAALRPGGQRAHSRGGGSASPAMTTVTRHFNATLPTRSRACSSASRRTIVRCSSVARCRWTCGRPGNCVVRISPRSNDNVPLQSAAPASPPFRRDPVPLGGSAERRGNQTTSEVARRVDERILRRARSSRRARGVRAPSRRYAMRLG